jgi:hypothetical protein
VRLPDDEPKVFADYFGLYLKVVPEVNDLPPEPATDRPTDTPTDVDPTHDSNNNKAQLPPTSLTRLTIATWYARWRSVIEREIELGNLRTPARNVKRSSMST